jgi:hypothetical protein
MSNRAPPVRFINSKSANARRSKEMAALVKMVQRVGPYIVMAIVMPGGTFVALGLYFYRRHRGLE